ncbi:MAG: hypothetical protein IRZ10_09510 [Thermoflavifilum sp.]|nr:hypothetical protein [Thermoflavifilum sp.]MCL6514644.1 hypothetical protein [Alicyclobacillus sp.]
MRISQVILHVSADDLNRAIAEFAPDTKARVTRIDSEGIHGEVRLWIWSVDLLLRPSVTADGQVAIEVSAQKLVPIPSAIVERQLRLAMKDAPAGVDVFQQALRVHLPSLLRPFGVSLALRELRTMDGYLRVAAEAVEFPSPLASRSGAREAAGQTRAAGAAMSDPDRPRISFADGQHGEV